MFLSDCPVGKYNVGTDCPACAKDYYKSTIGPQTCTLCPNNKITTSTESTEETDCCKFEDIPFINDSKVDQIVPILKVFVQL